MQNLRWLEETCDFTFAKFNFLKTNPLQTVKEPKISVFKFLAGNCSTVIKKTHCTQFKKIYARFYGGSSWLFIIYVYSMVIC